MINWKKYPLGIFGAFVVFLFILMGIYAPLLASSKPIFVSYHGEWYFPLFRYLFFSGYYTKPLDIFFNLLMFTFPFMLLFIRRPKWLLGVVIAQCVAFIYLASYGIQDPAIDLDLVRKRQALVQSHEGFTNFKTELSTMNSYARLNEVIRYILRKQQHDALSSYVKTKDVPSLYARDQAYVNAKTSNLTNYLQTHRDDFLKALDILSTIKKDHAPLIQSQKQVVADYESKAADLDVLEGKQKWLEQESKQVDFMILPLIRPFHWEDDAGGGQNLNQILPWTELTRINRKDLVAALIFGVRISLVVGFLAIGLALIIGVPIGAYAGYYGGRFDIVVSRLLEIWESMPTFFMLLLVVAMLQSKNVFLVIAVIGLFGWPTFSRYIRGEFFKQRSFAYVEACHAIGYPESRIIFTEILPNAIPPLITLLPFAIMGAISSEAGLSFLGLGEEGSGSWGVLMDEGRSAFPQEAYLLWPPAILLTTLLIAIALVGDALRDALDPKLR